MTYEEVKNLLKSVRSKKSRLLAMQAYIAEERRLMLGVTSPQFDGVSVVHSQENGPEKRITKFIDRLNKWKERYGGLFEEMCEEEDRLTEMMQKLSPVEYEVILNRYLKGLTVRKTASLMNYQEDSIKKICRKAIQKMTNYS